LPTATVRELELWAEHWAKPQARLWAHYGQELEVAIFVRRFVESEQPGAKVTLSALMQKLAASLLLTIPAMHSARVKLVEPVEQSRWATPAAAAPVRRLRADSSRLQPGDEGFLTASQRARAMRAAREREDASRPMEGVLNSNLS